MPHNEICMYTHSRFYIYFFFSFSQMSKKNNPNCLAGSFSSDDQNKSFTARKNIIVDACLGVTLRICVSLFHWLCIWLISLWWSNYSFGRNLFWVSGLDCRELWRNLNWNFIELVFVQEEFKFSWKLDI